MTRSNKKSKKDDFLETTLDLISMDSKKNYDKNKLLLIALKQADSNGYDMGEEYVKYLKYLISIGASSHDWSDSDKKKFSKLINNLKKNKYKSKYLRDHLGPDFEFENDSYFNIWPFSS